jgi:hypothetical protein
MKIIKQIHLTFKKLNNSLELTKQLLIYLLIMFIIVCYYYFIYKYILDIHSEIITTSTITMENLKPIEVPNVWYKSIIYDFFSKFSTKSKTIDQKYFEIQSFTKIEYNQDIINKSILDNIKFNHINNLVAKCEYYKEKISNLEIQVYYTRMIHNSLINDLHEILKDMEKWRK